MTDEETPPPADSVPPESPHDRGGRRRRLEGVIPEIVRRAVELGVEKAIEAPDNLKSFVGDLKLPKDVAHYLLTQIDETKNGLFRVVAKEIRDFLEHTNFAGEVQKLLTTVQFEVNTTIRFTPNDGRPRSKDRSKDKGKSRDKDSSESGEGEGEAAETASSDDGTSGERRVSSIPKPELKTSVHVRRDDSDRSRNRDRST